MIYIASDHGGFKLKNELIKYLFELSEPVTDLGPTDLIDEDDYPDYVYPVAHKVALDQTSNKGVLICRNGVGVSMLANKVKGIRATLSWTPDHAASSRKDDNTNILALPADYIDLETAKAVLKTWLDTKFSAEVRHKRRLQKIEHFENQMCPL